MKILKHKHKVSYTKDELNMIADKFNSEQSEYELFREFIWDRIKSAASIGKYAVSLNVSDYSDNYLNKIMDELLRNNMMCNLTKTQNRSYIGIAYVDSINIYKTLEICWNSYKAYLCK